VTNWEFDSLSCHLPEDPFRKNEKGSNGILLVRLLIMEPANLFPLNSTNVLVTNFPMDCEKRNSLYR
jgi:hypothetical protein